MSHEIRPDYASQFLFPPSLEDMIAEDHPARFVREFVDALDLRELGLTEEQQAAAQDGVGRPHYAADMLLKLWIYGYMYRITSSRGLERACRDLLPVLWLAGMHRPDHNTLWRFWHRYRAVIRAVFEQSVRVAMQAKMVGLVLQALDGTKIRSAAAKRSAWHEADLEKALGELQQQIDQLEARIAAAESDTNDPDDQLPKELQDRQALRERIRESLAELDKAECAHLQPLDRDARMMKSEGRTVFAYNAQAVVDEQAGIIVAAEVVNQVNDARQLEPMLEQTQHNVGTFAGITVTDSGYESAEGLGAADAMGAAVLVATKTKPSRVGPYHAIHFVYDEPSDAVGCPQGQMLTREGTKKHQGRRDAHKTYRCRVSSTCPVAQQCSKERHGRVIEISPHHAALVRNREHPEARSLLLRRQQVVERAFAEIKQVLGLRRWTVRGLDAVRTQWFLTCAAMNLRRMLAAFPD